MGSGKKGRSAGEGHVRWHSSGLAEARLYIPKRQRPAYKGQASVSFYGKTEKEALGKRAAAKRELDEGRIGGRNLKVSVFLRRWLDNPAAQTVSPRTFEDRKKYAEKYLIPDDMVGSLPLADLSVEELDNLYGRLMQDGVGVRTINHVHSTIRVALGRAVKQRLVSHNTARDAEPPVYSTRERVYRTLSQDEVTSFFKALADRKDRFEALYITAVLSGMRPAELRALRWQDVKMYSDGHGEALIHRTVSETKEHGIQIRNTTKTGKSRSVYLFPEVVAALKAHRTRQNEERLAKGGVWEDQDLLFPNLTGGPVRREHLTRSHFHPATKEAGIPKEVRPYDLRHTFGTLWVESGEDMKILQGILGHSRIETTANLYVHPSDRAQREAMKRFGASFRGS